MVFKHSGPPARTPVHTSAPFDFHQAFARNFGWVDRLEQHRLRDARIAIAGMGGVGGSHLLTLVRLGIGAVHIADYDCFELANFNRQAGATVSSLGRAKVDVLAELARDINPELDLKIFPAGVERDNLADFLRDVDVYVDGLDFFAVQARRDVFQACHDSGIPAITAAPLGMGVALLNFLPNKMSFEEYFQLQGQTETEQLLRFLVGLAPAALHRPYLVEPAAVDLHRQRGPSTAMACELCAGVAVSQVLKLILQRGAVLAAPWGLQFDAYRNRYKRTWRPGGNRHPVQRLALGLARRQWARGRADAVDATPPVAASQAPAPNGAAERILDLARWAPSGDNTQPWRFAIVDPHHLVIHGQALPYACVYDVAGTSQLLALGALLENITLAASAEGLAASAQPRPGATSPHTVSLDVYLEPQPGIAPDALLPYITERRVQRRAMRTRALTAREQAHLQAALGTDFELLWLNNGDRHRRSAWLAFQAMAFRLRLPEAYETHRRIIQWRAQFSDAGIPEAAVGADPLLGRVMAWALGSWQRSDFLNRYLAGPWLPALQLGLWPGLRCAGYFFIAARQAPQDTEDWLAAGRAMQRFWLRATQLGLWLQPEMTPLIFSQYLQNDTPFTTHQASIRRAHGLQRRLADLVSAATLARGVFMGRIGAGPAPKARSLRRPLEELLL